MNRPGAGWGVLRICIGIFFLFEGIGKIRWFANSSILGSQLNGWLQSSAPGSISRWYVATIALPHASVFARLVPLGELAVGVALILGLWVPLFALIAFFMALNFEIASGVVFRYAFLTNPYGFPVLGATLALALAGQMRRRWP
jgi:thiosulfate dehydrogenase [quinone] large subunit